MPELSILIATHARTQWLSQCLHSLESSGAPPDRYFSKVTVWVGINGQDPVTASFLKQWRQSRSSQSLNLEIIQMDQAVSPAAMRNRLLESCSGDWVLFLDDDIRLQTGFWQSLADALSEHPSAIVIGGPNLTPPESKTFERISGRVLATPFVTWFSSSRYLARGRTRSCGEESLILCNLLIRRDVLPDRPFPPALICAEENWLLLQLRNYPMVHAPKMAVFHHRRPGLLLFARQVFRYGVGRGQILRKAPTTLRWPHLIPSTFLIYTLALFLLLGLGAIIPYWAWLPAAGYVILGLLSGLHSLLSRSDSWIESLGEVLLYPIAHWSYGVGLLWGTVRRS